MSGPLIKKQAGVKLYCFVVKWAAREAKSCFIWAFYCHIDVLMGGGQCGGLAGGIKGSKVNRRRRVTTVLTKNEYLGDPGKARGCFTNTIASGSFID